MPFLETSDKKKFEHLCNVEKSHFPFLFIDDCTDKLPKESMLSQFTIVLTTVKVSSLKKLANCCDFLSSHSNPLIEILKRVEAWKF